MITLGAQTRLPSAYISYRITTAVLGFIFFFAIIAGFLILVSAISSAPGTTMTQTINGVQQQVPATPFVAGPAIGIAALVLAVLAIMSILYQVLYYSMFSFIVTNDRITVTSGILFTSDKSTLFQDVQTASVRRGPIMRMFGLGTLQGFTSSPDQVQIHSSGKGGSYTTYRPDINMVLSVDDAEILRTQISSTVDKVQMVAPAAVV